MLRFKVDGNFFFNYLQTDEQIDKQKDRVIFASHMWTITRHTISLSLFSLPSKYFYNLAYYLKIYKLCLDSNFVDWKRGFLHHLQTDKRTDNQQTDLFGLTLTKTYIV